MDHFRVMTTWTLHAKFYMMQRVEIGGKFITLNIRKQEKLKLSHLSMQFRLLEKREVKINLTQVEDKN